MPDVCVTCPACGSRLRLAYTQEGPGLAALDARQLEDVHRSLVTVAKPLDVPALDALVGELGTAVRGVVHLNDEMIRQQREGGG